MNQLREIASESGVCCLSDWGMDSSPIKPLRVEEVVAFFYDLVRDEPAVVSKIDEALRKRFGYEWRDDCDDETVATQD